MRRSSPASFLALLAVVAAGALLLGWWIGPLLKGRPAPAASDAGKLGSPAEDELTFEELASILRGQSGEPAAQAFAREFSAQPRLRKIWNRFVRSSQQSRALQAAPPTAQDFVRELKAAREFNELFARRSGEAGLRSLAQRLAAQPRVGAMVRQAGGRAPPGGSSSSSPETGGPTARVFGLYSVEELRHPPAPSVQDSEETLAGRAAPGTRGAGDPRIEGHWVHESGTAEGGVNLTAVCRMLGSPQDCLQAISACRRDGGCAQRLAAYEGGGAAGAVGASTQTVRDHQGDPAKTDPPKPSPRP